MATYGNNTITGISNTIEEDDLKISNAGSDGQFLQKQSGNTGGLTWATVDTSLADNAVTNAKLADDAVGIAELSASGTASATTFLRGDIAWAAPSGGKILQINRAATSSNLQTTSSSYSDVGVSLDITPSSTNSDFLILANFGVIRITQHTTASVYFKVLGGDSGTTQIDEWGTGWAFYTHADMREDRGYAAPTYVTHVVNPNTTTQQTYKMQWRMENTTGSGAYLYSPRNLTVMEISGGYA